MQRKWVLFILVCCLNTAVWAQKLYVFYPTFIRPQVLQSKLSEACPNLDITVFGRYPDFKRKIDTDPPDAVLTKPLVAQRFKGFFPTLRGSRKGSTLSPTILLSLDKNIQFDSLKHITIGVIDYMDRKSMDSLVASLFSQPPKTRHVSKPEDLLPLLRFNMAKAIFIEENDFQYFKKVSKLPFNIAKAPTKPLGIISLSAANEASATKIWNAFKTLPTEVMDVFSIDKWLVTNIKNQRR